MSARAPLSTSRPSASRHTVPATPSMSRSPLATRRTTSLAVSSPSPVTTTSAPRRKVGSGKIVGCTPPAMK